MAVLHIRCGFSWWVPVYLNTIVFFSWLTGMQPNMDKVASWVLKGLRLRVIGGGGSK